MLIAGLIVGLFGLGLALNLLRSADFFAAIARPFPWWMRGTAGANPAAYRVVGVVFIAMGAVFVVAGAGR